MAVAMPAAPLAMTAGQRQQFDENGFILLEDFFMPAELGPIARGDRRGGGPGAG